MCLYKSNYVKGVKTLKAVFPKTEWTREIS